ncbi:MAG: hypothetical protein IPK46_01200 [Saprospiraceae bacterium]|nr:hypothetical protein [Saprospiraceae bacterium]
MSGLKNNLPNSRDRVSDASTGKLSPFFVENLSRLATQEPFILAFTGFGTKDTFVYQLMHQDLFIYPHLPGLSDVFID